MKQPIISIIIPVFNEAAIIQAAIARLKEDPGIEVIIVDGGSQDSTVKLALEIGAVVGEQENKLQLIVTYEAGRANQMNRGAAIATGEILLFLHADTQLPENYQSIIQNLLAQPQVIAGAFKLAIDTKTKSFQLIETMVNLRSRFCSLPYGDQAIFLKKATFAKMGGYLDLPIMEDFDLIQRLKRQGKIAIASVTVLTSARRWQKLGIWQTTAINQLIILGYYLGVSPQKLRQFYRQMGSNKK